MLGVGRLGWPVAVHLGAVLADEMGGRGARIDGRELRSSAAAADVPVGGWPRAGGEGRRA